MKKKVFTVKDVEEVSKLIQEGKMPFGAVVKFGLNLREKEWHGNWLLNRISIVEGNLDLFKVIVTGRLDLSHMIINGSLTLYEATIGSNSYLGNMVIKGSLIAQRANIDGALFLDYATIDGDLILEDSTIRDFLDLRGIKVHGTLNLATKKAPKMIIVSPDMAELVHFAAPTVPLVVNKGNE